MVDQQASCGMRVLSASAATTSDCAMRASQLRTLQGQADVPHGRRLKPALAVALCSPAFVCGTVQHIDEIKLLRGTLLCR